jgi:RNA polymerase sigma-70 factor (ECF subfamily)
MLTFFLATLETDLDRLTFEKVYNLCCDDIHKRVLFRLKDEDRTQEVMQDIWKEVCEHISFFHVKDDVAIKSYILRMARNKAIFLYRKKRKEDGILCDINELDILDDISGDSTLRLACAREGEKAVFECLRLLDEKYSEILDFYYFNHNSIKEIAILLGIPERTAWTRYQRGREKLKELLAGRGFND